MPINITYKDALTEVADDKTATIKCAGKIMKSDLVIEYPSDEEEVVLKTFEIWNALSNDYSSTYEYKEGMTWQEFVNSEYNTGNFTVTYANEINCRGTLVYDSKNGASGGNSDNCIKSTNIINQDKYWLCASSSGGAN